MNAEKIEQPEDLNIDAEFVELKTWLDGKICNKGFADSGPAIEMPSSISLGNKCKLTVYDDNLVSYIEGFVVGVNFDCHKVRYNVAVKIEGSDYFAVIHNVDSCEVSALL